MLADPVLIAPVDSAARASLEDQVSGHAPYLRRGQKGQEGPQRRAVQRLTCIRDHQDLAGGPLTHMVEGCGLAHASLAAKESHPRIQRGAGCNDRIRAIGASVRVDENLHLVGWVVQGQQAAQLSIDVRFAIVGGYADAYGGLPTQDRTRTPRQKPRKQPDQHRIAEVRVAQKGQGCRCHPRCGAQRPVLLSTANGVCQRIHASIRTNVKKSSMAAPYAKS